MALMPARMTTPPGMRRSAWASGRRSLRGTRKGRSAGFCCWTPRP